MSVPGVLRAPILRPPSLFTIKTKKRIQRCAALYPQNNRSVTDVGTLPTSFNQKHLDFSHCKYTNFFYIAVMICFFFRRLFDKIEHFLLTLSEFRLRHVSVMVSDILCLKISEKENFFLVFADFWKAYYSILCGNGSHLRQVRLSRCYPYWVRTWSYGCCPAQCPSSHQETSPWWIVKTKTSGSLLIICLSCCISS